MAQTETVEEALKNPNSLLFQLLMNDIQFAFHRNEIITQKLILQTLKTMREENILQREELLYNLLKEDRIKSAAFAEAITQQTRETGQTLGRADQIQQQINRLQLEIQTLDTQIITIKQLNKQKLQASNANFISRVQKYLNLTPAQIEKMEKGLDRILTADKALEIRPELLATVSLDDPKSVEQLANTLDYRQLLDQEIIAVISQKPIEKEEGIVYEISAAHIFEAIRKMKEAGKEMGAERHKIDHTNTRNTIGFFKAQEVAKEKLEKIKTQGNEETPHKKLGY